MYFYIINRILTSNKHKSKVRVCEYGYYLIMGFKENLKNELLCQNLTVRQLADLSGVNKQTIDNYLSSHNSIPSADTAVRIARALNVSVEYLFAAGGIPGVPERYCPEVRKLADDVQSMNQHDRNIVISLVNAMNGR